MALLSVVFLAHLVNISKVNFKPHKPRVALRNIEQSKSEVSSLFL